MRVVLAFSGESHNMALRTILIGECPSSAADVAIDERDMSSGSARLKYAEGRRPSGKALRMALPPEQ